MTAFVSRCETSIRSWLIRPVSDFWCVMSWIGASALFFALCQLLGGPTESDAAETVYGTWLVANGHLSCIYPAISAGQFNDIASPFALTAPLYPILSGVAAAVFRIGHAVSFPSDGALGVQCRNAFQSVYTWSVHANAITPTIHESYFVWIALLGGTVALIRSSGRGRSSSEVGAVFLVACLPTVLMCITYYLHPEDLLATGLCLAGTAALLKKRWILSGIMLGLAFSSQQFSLLVLVPLLVVTPKRGRLHLGIGVLLALGIVDVPVLTAAAGKGIKTILLGTSRVGSGIRSTGGTWLWETDVHGAALFLLSRVLPVVGAGVLAWWASKSLGSRVLEPVPLLSVVASALVIRLVFEENLFGYYFMATSVVLVILSIVSGGIHTRLWLWIALVTVAFNPVHLGFVSNLTPWTVDFDYAIPIAVFAVVAASFLLNAWRGSWRIDTFLWLGLVALTCESKLWGLTHSVVTAPSWFWQMLLVPTALYLAIKPLLSVKSQKATCSSVSLIA